MFENLQVFENRLEELNLKLYDPQTAANRELYAELMKEYKELEPIVEAYREYRRCVHVYRLRGKPGLENGDRGLKRNRAGRF